MAKILIACEYSGRVRDAFIKNGHDAVSCDFEPTEQPGPHIQGDVIPLLSEKWDLMIAHPPCTHTAVSGARWFYLKQEEQKQALDFIETLWKADIPRIALEQPVSITPKRIGPVSQYIQPWMFGHNEQKKTALFLKNLPMLEPTNIITENIQQSVWLEPPGPNRWKIRSRTFQGVADAMGQQWGAVL